MCVFFAVTAYINVKVDTEEVRAMAWDAACKKDGSKCDALRDKETRRMERVPWVTTFTIDTPGKHEYEVNCKRSFVMVGDYSCKVE